MTLRGYEEVLPGSADRVIGMAEAESKAINEVRVRTAKAEQVSSIVATITIPAVQLASLAATVWLGVDGHALPATLASVPFLGFTVTQLTIVVRGRREAREDD